ncbi:hypothetical protein EDD86DRAFT_179805, partial [Gorgonomyces haynaldii]
LMSRILHLSIDAILVSAILAGAKRSAHLTYNTQSIENTTLRSVVDNYLWAGEQVLDFSITQLLKF